MPKIDADPSFRITQKNRCAPQWGTHSHRLRKLTKVHNDGTRPVYDSRDARMLSLIPSRTLNTQRHGHGLIEILRLRESFSPGSGTHQALGDALASAAASTLDGSFRDIRVPLERARAALPEGLPASAGHARHLQLLVRYLSDTDVAVPHGSSTAMSVGTQALAGVICGRLMTDLATDAERGLINKLAASESRDEIAGHLRAAIEKSNADYSVALGSNRAGDLARDALDYVIAFDVVQVQSDLGANRSWLTGIAKGHHLAA